MNISRSHAAGPHLGASKQWRWRAFAGLSLLSAFSLIDACAPVTEQNNDAAEHTQTRGQAATGKDGPRTIASGSVILNQYAVLSADALKNATTLHVSNAAALSSPTDGPLDSGDLIMIVQMQGATMTTDDGPSYGTLKSLRGAGQYELAEVASISGNTISLLNQCGLQNTYQTASHVQIVRVPQYTTLSVAAGATVTGQAWDGQIGGVIAVRAKSVALDGAINASGLGFRGGRKENETRPPTMHVTTYRSSNAMDGAEKGESVVGYGGAYDALGGRYGRGAPANGGGGGNSHNAGGGGGANVSATGLQPWTGQGVMDVSQATWAQAWALDPGYIANGGALTVSQGGGRGGYSYSGQDRDALTVAPGLSLWGGNFRRNLGGLGGHALTADPGGHVFPGGGGGAGDANHHVGGDGGAGGGVVIIIAESVTGSGEVHADGAAGQDTSPENNDAPGGAGAGGTVVIDAPTVGAQLQLTAKGGRGGNQRGPVKPTDIEAEGPGGGGGGGLIAIRAGNPLRDASGGMNGVSHSGALTEFLPNGATKGAAGIDDATIVLSPICAADLDSDHDGIQDQQEINAGSDPHDRDTDDDGLLDGEEPGWNQDSDHDGTINVLDPDSDNDGLWDGTEAGKGCTDPDTDPTKNHCIPDADFGATTTDPTNADTDNGGLSDGTEDANHNGQVDTGEKDPLAAIDDKPGCFNDSDCGGPNSGQVCQRNGQDAAHGGMCVVGCRGLGGNGCPTGLTCSSHTSQIGACVDIGDASCPICPDASCTTCPDASCPDASCATCPDASCPDASCATCPDGSCPDASCATCPDASCATCPDAPCPDASNPVIPDSSCANADAELAPSSDVVAYGGSSCSWMPPGRRQRGRLPVQLLMLFAGAMWFTRSRGRAHRR